MDHILQIHYQSFDQGKDLESHLSVLLVQALDVTNLAYAPYSKFKVGAALLLENNITLVGCNQENASYPCGICAERNVLFSKGAQHPKAKIKCIAIVVQNQLKDINTPPTPCGLCRQVLSEFEFNNHQPIQIILGHPDRKTWVFNSCADLLPFAFTPSSLI